MKRPISVGDYVLATKYGDGDPGDHFCVGIVSCIKEKGAGDLRFHVVDSVGRLFRGNGFRRAERITRRRGDWIVSKLSEIAASSVSVWWWKTARMNEEATQ